MFHTYNPQAIILKVKVNTANSKVKSKSHHDGSHLQPLSNVPTKYLPTPYGFRDITWTRFYRSRSLWQGQIKISPWRCSPTIPNQCSYQVSTSYTLRFPRYSRNQLFPAARQPWPLSIQTPWVKTILQQPLRAMGYKWSTYKEALAPVLVITIKSQ